MFDYIAHGLKIKSKLDLPGFKPIGEIVEPDVVIEEGAVKDPKHKEDGRRTTLHKGSEIVIHWREWATISIRDGKKITVDQVEGSDDRIVELLVAGSGLGVLLHQRGRVTLHASAVVIGGEAVAFAGEKGMGKSTTATAFMRKGYPVLTDDVLAIETSVSPPEVSLGGRHFKLWPDAAAATLDSEAKELSAIYPGNPKKAYSVSDGPAASFPLRCIYLLGYDDKDGCTLPRTRVPSPKNAYMEVTMNNYALRFLRKSGINERHFRSIKKVVESVPVRVLVRNYDPGKIHETIEFVKRDLEEL